MKERNEINHTCVPIVVHCSKVIKKVQPSRKLWPRMESKKGFGG